MLSSFIKCSLAERDSSLWMKVLLEGKKLSARKVCSSNIREKISLDFLAKAGSSPRELNSSSVCPVVQKNYYHQQCWQWECSLPVLSFQCSQASTATDTYAAVEEPPWLYGLNIYCTDLMKLPSRHFQVLLLWRAITVVSQKPQGTQTSQRGPPSPVFHKDEVGLISLLRNFLLKLPFESVY